MKKENECTALVKYEPQKVARKKDEVAEALEKGLIGDPISGSVITSLLISAAVSATGSPIAQACMPKRK